ncbi:hypothetical protein AB4212_67435, partial [Streptomyces sp. 2MCAF27]
MSAPPVPPTPSEPSPEPSSAPSSEPSPPPSPRPRLARRLVHLYAGLVLYGVSMALQLRAGLGLDPWDVFH